MYPSGQISIGDKPIARTAGHNILPSVVGPETPEQGQMFDETMTGAMMIGGREGRPFFCTLRSPAVEAMVASAKIGGRGSFARWIG